jgi:hypothetical protein
MMMFDWAFEVMGYLQHFLWAVLVGTFQISLALDQRDFTS